MFKKILSMLLTAAFLGGMTVTLAACNTIAGAGQDVSKAGDKVTEEAQEHKKY